ncbi:MAG: lipocalin-like domain-containing protein [Candidatus Velthaea sp.]|jgi:predicted secreted hydrolase
MMRALAFVLALVVSPFTSANAPYAFRFPRDHAAHAGYQSEWWYYTGHIRTRDGRRFGYELTFFRVGLAPGDPAPGPLQSGWRGNQLYPAHFALTDESSGRFFYAEKLAREALGMGRASTARLDVRVDDWWLRGSAPFRMHAAAPGGTTIDFVQFSQKPPAIHGHDGISRKAACATCASHYYSLTRLHTTGFLTYGGARLPVEGISWMDHEFGSGELQANQVGWDWFSIQLDDRREVMLYRLRQTDGRVTPESSGSLVDPHGRVVYVPLAGFSIAATGSWTSPVTHGVYPSGWRVRVPQARLDLTLTPAAADQELANTSGGVSYWEGAVDVRDASSGRVLGVGYVELTGYAGTVSL